MEMKRALLALLLPTLTLTSCETTHNAAVASFRVLDAPHQYIRRKLNLDENNNPIDSTTPAASTTTAATSTTAPEAPPPEQPFQQNPPPPAAPPPQVTSREVTQTSRQEERSSARSVPEPTATPRLGRSSGTTRPVAESTPASGTKTSSTEKTGFTYAKPVPGKPGYVFSPFDPNGGYVDVTGFAPGSKVKDPYSGKIFLVP